MSFRDKYIRRLSRNGNNVGEVYKSNTIAFIESRFEESPTYRLAEVKSTEFPDINEIDIRVIEIDRMGSLREIVFRPSESLNIGSYIMFDNDAWLIFDKYGSEETISTSVLVERCNQTLKWKDINDKLVSIDCVASSTDLGSKAKQNKNDVEWNKFDVRLPLGQMFVFIEANELTKAIRHNFRFIFGSLVYEVVGYDDVTAVNMNGFGLIQFTLKLTTKQAKDDFVGKIAFNDYSPTNTGQGGLVW